MQSALPDPEYICLLCGERLTSSTKDLIPNEARDGLLCRACHGPAGFLAHRDELQDISTFAQSRVQHILKNILPTREALKIKATPEVRALTKKMLAYGGEA